LITSKHYPLEKEAIFYHRKNFKTDVGEYTIFFQIAGLGITKNST